MFFTRCYTYKHIINTILSTFPLTNKHETSVILKKYIGQSIDLKSETKLPTNAFFLKSRWLGLMSSFSGALKQMFQYKLVAQKVLYFGSQWKLWACIINCIKQKECECKDMKIQLVLVLGTSVTLKSFLYVSCIFSIYSMISRTRGDFENFRAL